MSCSGASRYTLLLRQNRTDGAARLARQALGYVAEFLPFSKRDPPRRC